LLEVAANRIENHPEATQHLRRAGWIDGRLNNWFHEAWIGKKRSPEGLPTRVVDPDC
jgi:hypothetical protein